MLRQRHAEEGGDAATATTAIAKCFLDVMQLATRAVAAKALAECHAECALPRDLARLQRQLAQADAPVAEDAPVGAKRKQVTRVRDATGSYRSPRDSNPCSLCLRPSLSLSPSLSFSRARLALLPSMGPQRSNAYCFSPSDRQLVLESLCQVARTLGSKALRGRPDQGFARDAQSPPQRTAAVHRRVPLSLGDARLLKCGGGVRSHQFVDGRRVPPQAGRQCVHL